MISLKIIGATALLAIAPVLVSATADARPNGGGVSRGGGGGGGGFRGGMSGGFRGGGFAARPSFGGGPRVGNFAGRAAIVGAGAGAFAGRQAFAARPGFAGQRWAGNGGQRWAGGHWRGRRGYGYGIAGGLALGALGSSYYYGDPYYDDSYAYAPDAYYGDDQYAVAPAGDDSASCAQRYRSYDPASGTYLAYDGNRYACP